MSDWLSILTAPRDGTYVRLKFGNDETSEADDDGPYVGAWVNDGWWDRSGSDYGYGTAEPTHWRPESEQESGGQPSDESGGAGMFPSDAPERP